MKKYIADVDSNGVPTGKHVLVEASVLDVLNPIVPLDSDTSLIRTLGLVLFTALVS